LLDLRFRPVPSYTSAVKKEDFKAAAIFDEMEKTLKGVWTQKLIFSLSDKGLNCREKSFNRDIPGQTSFPNIMFSLIWCARC